VFATDGRWFEAHRLCIRSGFVLTLSSAITNDRICSNTWVRETESGADFSSRGTAQTRPRSMCLRSRATTGFPRSMR
jgi:hypothetical protein